MTPEQQARATIDDYLQHAGWDVQNRDAMNLYLQGIGHNSERSPIHVDALLASKPSDTYDVGLTYPPFGKKSSVTYTTEETENRSRQRSFCAKTGPRTSISTTSPHNQYCRFGQLVQSASGPV